MAAMPETPDPHARLRLIGWSADPDLNRAAEGQRVARVIGQHRSGYDVAEFPDDLRRVQPPAAWTRPRGDPTLRAAVGDWVALALNEAELTATIHAVLPRLTKFSRRAAGDADTPRVVRVADKAAGEGWSTTPAPGSP